MSDDSDSDSLLQQKRKRKGTYVIRDDDRDESVVSDSSIEITLQMKRTKTSKKNYIDDSESDSDSTFEIFKRKRRIGRVNSDTSNSSSSTIITRKTRRVPRAISDTSTDGSEDGGFEGSSDSSQWETDGDEQLTKPAIISLKETNSSDSSDEQAERCPICLLRFKHQEIGTPESCDHHFCFTCIQEWSKNINTCPVDRQPFSLILVRKSLNGKVVRQIPAEPPTQQVVEVEEDVTFCEICGMSDREDRMLLCDRCDLGFHLECLTPPLDEVPEGYWYCNECGSNVDFFDAHLLFNDDEESLFEERGRRNYLRRLMPRTRQNERLSQRVRQNRRNNNRHEENVSENRSNSSGIEDSIQAGPSTTSTTRRRGRTRRRRYRTVYQVDEATGETVQVRKKVKKRKNRRKARARARAVAQKQKTVKGRLATQLGICRQRSAIQHLPDVRAVGNSNSISLQRHEAGIPRLHLFGQDDEIDYFSGSDGESGETGVLFRRRPTRSDANVLRNQMRRKMISVPVSALPSSDDLLSSILESQTKLHSKNSVLSLNKDGSLKVESNNNRVNVNNNNGVKFRQTPLQPTSNNENSFTNTTNSFNNDTNSTYNTFIPTVSASSSSVVRSTSENSDLDRPHDYTQSTLCDVYYQEEKENKEKKSEENKNCDSISGDNTPKSNISVHSDSELDIYSDIETVSTSKLDEQEEKSVTPALIPAVSVTGTDDENNDSDTELVIDTEKLDSSDKYDPTASIDSEESSKEETVSSSVDASFVSTNSQLISVQAHSTSDIQTEKVQSSSQLKEEEMKEEDVDEDDGDEDGCPNFSIYSTESINLAKTTDLGLLSEKNQQECSEITSTPIIELVVAKKEEKPEEEAPVMESTTVESVKKSTNSNALYSDSEDDIKIEVPKAFGIGDIQNMTEDISEEERSYTPCLDEKMKTCQEGLDGLDTEMISDEDRNDFDESHELKTASDGDALEINAKDSELDFTKPEDYEEGEIVDKSKLKKQPVAKKDVEEGEKEKPTKKEKEVADDKNNKENEKQSKSEFKKLSKSNKERNYRDKDKEKSRSRSKDKKDNKKEKKKEKRKEIERYDVRSIISEKPRRLKDKFGRDVSKRSPSRSTRSVSPYGSPSRAHRSGSRSRKRRSRSRHRRSYSKSRTPDRRYSRSAERRRSRSRNRKRKRSSSYEDEKSKRDRSRRERSRSRHRSRSGSVRRRRDWDKKRSKEWTPSLSRSRSPEIVRHVSPSWTPPRVVDKAVKSHNLTVILTNDSSKKKKEKKKKSDKKNRDGGEKKKKRRNKTPPPSKEVFASGDNILVSVSFNKDNETRDVTTKRKKDHVENIPPKKTKKSKNSTVTPKTKKTRDLSGVKPVAIIDLDKSPFKELTPSPKDIIVLSDSDNGENNEMMGIQKAVCDSSQHVASPEAPPTNSNYTMGPKTPPEPQIKFSLNPKPQQLRPITNPLHEPDEVETEIDTQQERPAEVVHKGPNTPPEPPNSPPSSPDAYDPFDPTKSRSPTPETIQTNTQPNSISVDNNHNESRLELRPTELTDKASTPVRQTTPDALKSHTPPLLETQPDSQSSILTNTPDRPKSPEVTLAQTQNALFPPITSKPVVSAIPYSSTSSAASLITSTPVSSNLSVSRINILSSTILTSPHVVSSAPQRIVLPNTVKSSPVKIPIKSTPIKPMPTKNVINKQSTRKITKNDSSSEVINLDFDSPYSPGSSDYEDLFEPPPEGGVKQPSNKTAPQKTTKSPIKPQTAFDALFGSSPTYGNSKNRTVKNDKAMTKGAKKALPLPSKGKNTAGSEESFVTSWVLGTKQIGVKLDEDNLKILDELPNSAVEMQVKDKFLKKLNRQERVVEEVKLVLKPHYNKKHINKEEYKDILRRAVPKICHNRSGEINPKKIQNLIEAYVKKVRHSKKVTSSSSSVNPQKV